MKKIVKNIGWFCLSILLTVSIIALPFSLSNISHDNIVFGNFQSYMSPTVMKEMDNKYDINWQYYSSNAEIPTYIQNKTLDVAIASNNMIAQLIIEDSIQEIDWSMFDLYTPSGTKVVNYSDLEQIVTPTVWNLCETIGNLVCGVNLLKYTIPYFCQNIIFAYNGSKINDQKINDNSSFKNIFEYISNNDRFINTKSSVMMVEDARTVFGVANIINDQNINPVESIITINNKKSNISMGINKMQKIYQNISNYYINVNKNTLTFNSDSNIILNKLANNEINGAFFYNGDAIYSLLGGDLIDISSLNDQEITNWTNNKHVIIPNKNFIAMDGIVINKLSSNSKKEQIYQIIKDIVLDLDKIQNTDDNDEYTSLTMQNFDYVNYSPCYLNLMTYVKNEYFKNIFPNNPEFCTLLEQLIDLENVSITDQNVEFPINYLAESDMNIAFLGFINEL